MASGFRLYYLRMIWSCRPHLKVTSSSPWNGLQLSVKRWGIRIRTSKAEAMDLTLKTVDCPLQVWVELLPQVAEFKNLGVLFISEGRMERDIDRWMK